MSSEGGVLTTEGGRGVADGGRGGGGPDNRTFENWVVRPPPPPQIRE